MTPSEAAPAIRSAKPSMRLPMAVVRPKRKAEPPESNRGAAGQPAKKRGENGIIADSGTSGAKADSDGDAAGLGGLAEYGSDSA